MGKPARHKRADSTRCTCHAPEAKAVFLAGTFNGWNTKSTSMAKDANGNWSVPVDLKPGRYEYKLVIDGAWCCAPGCDDRNFQCAKCVVNGYGTMNRVIEVT